MHLQWGCLRLVSSRVFIFVVFLPCIFKENTLGWCPLGCSYSLISSHASSMRTPGVGVLRGVHIRRFPSTHLQRECLSLVSSGLLMFVIFFPHTFKDNSWGWLLIIVVFLIFVFKGSTWGSFIPLHYDFLTTALFGTCGKIWIAGWAHTENLCQLWLYVFTSLGLILDWLCNSCAHFNDLPFEFVADNHRSLVLLLQLQFYFWLGCEPAVMSLLLRPGFRDILPFSLTHFTFPLLFLQHFFSLSFSVTLVIAPLSLFNPFSFFPSITLYIYIYIYEKYLQRPEFFTDDHYNRTFAYKNVGMKKDHISLKTIFTRKITITITLTIIETRVELK